MKNNFAVFILTHGRPDSCKTINALKRMGYTGRIILILDDTDKTINQYKKNYPDVEYYVFSKREGINITDTADNTDNPKAVVYARNMCHRIARELNIEYFLELDDDYWMIYYRSDENDNFNAQKQIKDFDSLCDIFIKFLDNTDTKSIAFAQAGDFIGGYDNPQFGKKITLHRKCMNSFFCKTDRPFKFYGLINEDVNCYTLNATRGELYFTATQITLVQGMTQQNEGGLTDIYLELGTYIKSFYSVIYCPSSVKIK